MAEKEKCAHDGCSCLANGDSDYCSPHCANAEDSDLVEIKCECGHSNCG